MLNDMWRFVNNGLWFMNKKTKLLEHVIHVRFACCNWQNNHSDYKIEKLLQRTGNQSTHDHTKVAWLCKSAQLPLLLCF